jgi:CRISPR/Cas system Type II protein with McrA/HNH and RuvC-like nuclease domain
MPDQEQNNIMTVKEERIIVYKKYNCRCAYCGKEITFKQMQVDHMSPKHLSWMNKVLFEGVVIDKTNDIENLMPSCRRCNHYKRGDTVESFRKSMLTLHERIAAHYINKVAIDFGMMIIKPFSGKFYFESGDAGEK